MSTLWQRTIARHFDATLAKEIFAEHFVSAYSDGIISESENAKLTYDLNLAFSERARDTLFALTQHAQKSFGDFRDFPTTLSFYRRAYPELAIDQFAAIQAIEVSKTLGEKPAQALFETCRQKLQANQKLTGTEIAFLNRTVLDASINSKNGLRGLVPLDSTTPSQIDFLQNWRLPGFGNNPDPSDLTNQQRALAQAGGLAEMLSPYLPQMEFATKLSWMEDLLRASEIPNAYGLTEPDITLTLNALYQSLPHDDKMVWGFLQDRFNAYRVWQNPPETTKRAYTQLAIWLLSDENGIAFHPDAGGIAFLKEELLPDLKTLRLATGEQDLLNANQNTLIANAPVIGDVLGLTTIDNTTIPLESPSLISALTEHSVVDPKLKITNGVGQFIATYQRKNADQKPVEIRFALDAGLTESQIVSHVKTALTVLSDQPRTFQNGVDLMEIDFATCQVHYSDSEKSALKTQTLSTFNCNSEIEVAVDNQTDLINHLK